MESEVYKPFDPTQTPANNDGRGRGFAGNFTDWYSKLDDTKKNALSSGLMNAGFTMMQQGAGGYNRPATFMGALGAAGTAGMNTYHGILETERRDQARNRGLALNEGYLGLSKNREGREAEVFAAESPYLKENAGNAAKLKGLQVGLAESTIARNNVIANMKGQVNLAAADKAKFQQSKETISLIADGMKTDFGVNIMNADPEQLAKAMSKNPTKMQKINEELSKPGNERKKAAWDNAWNNIYGSMGVSPTQPGTATAQGGGGSNVDMKSYINDLLNYDYTAEEEGE